MEIDPTSLQGHDKEDIISVFIEHVVKTEEEVEEKGNPGWQNHGPQTLSTR